MFLDFGFSQSSFSGSERGKSYRVQVKFFSGGIITGILFSLSLNLSGTASKYGNYFKVTSVHLQQWSLYTICPKAMKAV